MKAWGLTASIPVPENKCDKNCDYCISHMSGFVEPDQGLVLRNLKKVYRYADKTGATTFLITSKREPFLNIEVVLEMARNFREFAVEIQTNGIWLNTHQESLDDLFDCGMNTIAFSIDRLHDFERYAGLFENIKAHKMGVRVCLNLTDMIPVEMSFDEIFDKIKSTGNISQVLIRNVSIPSNISSGSQYDWIKKHTSFDRYLKLAQEFERIIIKECKIPIQIFPFGMKTYSHRGISVAFSDYCIQESNNTEDIRSLIFLEDGHLYTKWNDLASYIF